MGFRERFALNFGMMRWLYFNFSRKGPLRMTAMTATDPRELIDRSNMTMAQVIIVVITVLLNAMDGFDILSIAFAEAIVFYVLFLVR